MRNTSILTIAILFIVSCSYKKRENTYQKQLSESLPTNVISQKDITISMSIIDHLKKNFYAIKCDTLIFTNSSIDKRKICCINDTIFSGYTDTFVEQVDIELYFDEKRAKEISIEPGWYICDYIAVSLNLSMPQNKTPFFLSSKQCGFKPGGSGSRGYIMAILNDTQTLYSYVYHVKSDGLKVIDVFYPKLENNGRLLDLKWNIGYI